MDRRRRGRKKVPAGWVLIGVLILFSVLILWADVWVMARWLLALPRLALRLPYQTPQAGETLRAFYTLGTGFIFFALSILVVSQFVLPVRRGPERWKACERLCLHLLGMRGPTIKVKDGKQIARPGEHHRRYKGVVLVDLSSAIVLDRQGAMGPGVVFTETGEQIRGAVDLRKQSRSRKEVTGSTRDGIEVSTSISVSFSLGEEPETLLVTPALDETLGTWQLKVVKTNRKLDPLTPGGEIQTIQALTEVLDEQDQMEVEHFLQSYRRSPGAFEPLPERNDPDSLFPYHCEADRVFAAIHTQAREGRAGEIREWTELPTLAATEVFRNLLACEKYADLYLPNEPQKYPLDNFKAVFSQKVRNLGVLNFQVVERKDGRPLEVGETWTEDSLILYPKQRLKGSKVLRDRGIKILRAGFSDLRPISETVRRQLLENWRARWQNHAVPLSPAQETQAVRIRTTARAKAQREMADFLSQILKRDQVSDEVMAVRIFKFIDGAASDPMTHQLLPRDTLYLLDRLRRLLLPDSTRGTIAAERGGAAQKEGSL